MMTPENRHNVKEEDKEKVASLEQPENVMQEWRIMLLGKTGAGKSSTGNTILGKEVFKSDMTLARLTKFCEKKTGNVDGRLVSVIDTPGLFETKRTEKEVIREILKSVSLYRPGPHVFVVVVPVGRLTIEEQHTNKLIENMFGTKIWDYCILLFTHGDRLEGKTLNDVIADADHDLRDFIRKCSGGFLVFNNKDVENRDQVTKLLEKIETLVAINGRGCYRTELYPTPEKAIRERQESILAEKDAEIGRVEKQLEERYKDEELEKKKRELWRREEQAARTEAEKQPFPTFHLFVIALLLAVGVTMGMTGTIACVFVAAVMFAIIYLIRKVKVKNG